MDQKTIIPAAVEFAKGKMKHYDPGHDWWHVQRVRKLAAHINSVERSADPFILDLAAILHDVADLKFNHPEAYREIGNFLEECGLAETGSRIIGAIRNVAFSNRKPKGDLNDPLLHILQDADRLDAIGAIGIARAFSYGSSINNPIYLPPDENGVMAPSTIRHFHDKLLRLKDLMNTETAKTIAMERHSFLETFLGQFAGEWNF